MSLEYLIYIRIYYIFGCEARVVALESYYLFLFP